MKRYSASELRENLARALDEVEGGKAVVVERRGQRFRIALERPAPPARRIPPFFRLLDPTLLERGWSWDWKGPGKPPRLVVGRRRKPR